MDELSGEELAVRSGVAAEQLRRLVEPGIITPTPPGRFRPSDIQRIRVVDTLAEAGFAPEQLSELIATGAYDRASGMTRRRCWPRPGSSATACEGWPSPRCGCSTPRPRSGWPAGRDRPRARPPSRRPSGEAARRRRHVPLPRPGSGRPVRVGAGRSSPAGRPAAGPGRPAHRPGGVPGRRLLRPHGQHRRPDHRLRPAGGGPRQRPGRRRRRPSGGVRFEPVGPVPLKGLSAPITLYTAVPGSSSGR
jgi:DNA-binding transcriptional MerR regulator